jgi:hypothetical protein
MNQIVHFIDSPIERIKSIHKLKIGYAHLIQKV